MDKAAAERYLPAARVALAAYPIAPGGIEPVAIAENITFKVTDAVDGSAYVLRLHRPGYHDLPALESERAWTAALAEAGIGAPRGLRASSGAWFAPVEIEPGVETRLAGVTAWTDGELLSSVLDREPPGIAGRHFDRLGAVVAALHDQARDWSPPPGFVRHDLGRDGLMGEAPFWGRFWESEALGPAERAAAERARGRILPVLDRLGRDPTRFSLIHADLHPGNVLVNGEGLAIIDFDDAGFGWHVYDIAVALFYAQWRADFPDILAAFLAGYRGRRALDGASEALIPLFLAIRGLAIFGWLAQRPELDPTPFMDANKANILAACEALDLPG